MSTSGALYDEKLILQLVAKGDQQAFHLLFDQYKKRIFSFVFRLVHAAADAEEIVQEVFVKLWESRESLATVEYPGSYIYTIARNSTLNFLAKAARDKQLGHQLWLNLSLFDNTTEELLQAKESQTLISRAVSMLSEQKQTIFRLSREEGLTHEQIAARMGLSKSRVNNLLVEILRHIKDQLNRHSPLLAMAFWLCYGSLLF